VIDFSFERAQSASTAALNAPVALPFLFFTTQAHLTSLQWAHLLELNFNALNQLSARRSFWCYPIDLSIYFSTVAIFRTESRFGGFEKHDHSKIWKWSCERIFRKR
jgi:hypothetical protein